MVVESSHSVVVRGGEGGGGVRGVEVRGERGRGGGRGG